MERDANEPHDDRQQMQHYANPAGRGNARKGGAWSLWGRGRGALQHASRGKARRGCAQGERRERQSKGHDANPAANTHSRAIKVAEKIKNTIKQGLYEMWKVETISNTKNTHNTNGP